MNRALTVALMLSLLTGCGWTVDTAREAAALNTCGYMQRCGDVGSGQRYASAAECLTDQRSFWLSAWPSSACQDKLSADALDTCLKAIDNTTCDSALDWLATAAKCTSGAVCK